MSTAVKKGFAIGFVLAVVLGGLWAWREGLWRPTDRRQVVAPAELSEAPRRTEPDRPSSAEPAPPAPVSPPPAGSQPEARGPSSPPPAAARPEVAPAAQEKGAFDVVRVEPTGEAVVAGRCSAGCSAELTANGRTIDTAKADAGGAFAMTPPRLPPGDYQLGLILTAPDGRREVSGQTVTVSIPKPPSKDVVVVLNDPDSPSRILQRPEHVETREEQAAKPAVGEAVSTGETAPKEQPAAAADAPLSLGAIDAERGRFFIQGAAPAGAKLRIYLNNALVAEPVAGPDGRWSLRVERGLAPGRYVVRVDHVDAAGKVAKRAEASFEHEPDVAAAPSRPADQAPPAPIAAGQGNAQEPADAVRSGSMVNSDAAPAGPDGSEATSAPKTPVAPAEIAQDGARQAEDQANPVVAAIDTAKVRRGDSLWRISRTTYGHGRRYTIIFDANDSQIRNPNLIYPGQVLVLPTDSAAAAKEGAR